MINWMAFDWPSFATLAAGAMAVVGATIIGLKQARIADRQREILQRQTRLAEMALRHDLFDKRYAVYEATSRFLRANLSVRAADREDTALDFLKALQDARFIFRPLVSERLEEMWALSVDLDEVRDELAEAKAAGLQQDVEKKARLREFKKVMRNNFAALGDLFGPELHLGELDEAA